MTRTQWEYKTMLVNVMGWLGPNIDSEGLNEVLNDYGAEGWELVSAFDVNRTQGATGGLMIMLKRPR